MKGRIAVLGVLLALFAAWGVRRAWELQVERAPALREMAEAQYLRDVSLAPKRGTIFDRHGAELAVSVDTDSVWANPRELRSNDGDPAAITAQLVQLLGVDEERIRHRLESDRYFVWIKRRVTPQVAAQVRALDLPGVHLDQEARRYYPNRELASHVLGFANIDGVGVEGLERSLDERLRGSSESVPAIRDRRGRVVFSEQLFDDRAAQGEDLWLTLDKTIQHVAERELELAVRTFEAQAGSVVVMNPRSGEILAMANYPTFDANTPGAVARASDRRNRAVMDHFEPGSTVKPFTIAAAIAAGTISSEELIDCEGGSMDVAEYTIHDTSPHDMLTPAQCLAYSSNICLAKVGDTLGRRGLYRALRRHGFGEVTGLPLPAEGRGILRHHRRWYEMDAATISFGQGMSVTGVQLATAMSVLANGGRLVRPRILQRITDASGQTVEETVPEVRRRVMPERVARLVTDMLTAVTGPDGTAPQAAIDGFLVAGKTGTAQKADYNRGGYAEDKWLASFVGMVPAEDPELVISVVIDEPVIAHYGGVVAGPVFRRIGERALRHLGVSAAGGGQALAEHSSEQRRRRRLTVRREREAARAARIAARERRRAGLPPLEEEATEAPVRVAAEGEVLVPDLSGETARGALVAVTEEGLGLRIDGSGIVRRQLPLPGASVPPGTVVEVSLAVPSDEFEDDGIAEGEAVAANVHGLAIVEAREAVQ